MGIGRGCEAPTHPAIFSSRGLLVRRMEAATQHCECRDDALDLTQDVRRGAVSVPRRPPCCVTGVVGRSALLSPPTARMTRARTCVPGPKSVSRIRLADNNLDGVERRLRPPGSQQANAEELLAELVRLIESSGLTAERLRPPAGTMSEPIRADTEPMQRREITSLRPSVEAPSGKPRETRVIDVEPQGAPESGNSYSNGLNGTDLATGRPGTRKFMVSALVLVSAAVVGSILWLK